MAGPLKAPLPQVLARGDLVATAGVRSGAGQVGRARQFKPGRVSDNARHPVISGAFLPSIAARRVVLIRFETFLSPPAHVAIDLNDWYPTR